MSAKRVRELEDAPARRIAREALGIPLGGTWVDYDATQEQAGR